MRNRNEEAIKFFNTLLAFNKVDCPKEEIMEYIKMAIEALEQDNILDKIRSEIMSKDGLEEALEIIDKYRK